MTEQDIFKVQNLWSEGIIKMGQISDDRQSLEIYVSDFLDRLYNFDNQVLFKPTKAKDTQLEMIKILLSRILLQEMTGIVMKILGLHYQLAQNYL